jgi:glutamate-1-semialdehyde 2,1-aminomutase
MFSVFFGVQPEHGPVRDYAGAQAQDVGAFRAFFHEMLGRGVYLPPSAFESWFLSAAHDDEAVGRVVDALPDAARAAAEAQPTEDAR